MQIMGKAVFLLFLIFNTPVVFATAYPKPLEDEVIIGEAFYTKIAANDTLVDIATKYDIGFNALESANAHLNFNKGLLVGTPIQIPTQHLLPQQTREGIVINLPEMRMYYFPKNSDEIFTYPIGIGKIGKTIPIVKAKITGKKRNPIWIPTQGIRDFNLQQGIVLPKVMKPGPDNPLGHYGIYLSIPTYLIHSSPFKESIGQRASFGCIRMFESDIKTFFPTIETNTPVVIINTPVKLAWQGSKLYIEIHQPLLEHKNAIENSLTGIVKQIDLLTKGKKAIIDWEKVSFLAKEKDGLPHEIGSVLSD